MAEKKRIEWSKLILVTSLGLNLVIAGVVIGAWAKRGDREASGASFVAGPFGRAFSKEDRRAMEQRLRDDGGLRSQRGEMRAIGRDIATVLRNQPLDVDALTALFDKQAQLGTRQRALGQQAMLQRFIAMTPEQRIDFAERLEQGMKRGRSRGNR